MPSTDTNNTVTGLVNGIAYRFRVAAVNAYGAGQYAFTGPVTPELIQAPVSGTATLWIAEANQPVYHWSE